MSTRASALLGLLAAACGGKELAVEIVPIDAQLAPSLSQLVVTAVEPFAMAPESASARSFVTCNQIGVFPPTARYDRDGTSVRGLDRLLLNRDFHDFTGGKLGDSWSLELPQLQLGEDTNPWGAVLFLVEARGNAQIYERSLQMPAPATLLQSCFCVRLNPDASHPDRATDEMVKAACPGPTAPDGGPRKVEFTAVPPAEFRLESCGVKDATAPVETRSASGPAVCVRTTRCDQSPGGGPCFSCEGVCTELDDLKNVPIRLVDTRSGSEKASVVLTGKEGRAVPDIPVGQCTTPFKVKASIFGRTDEVEFDVSCVPSVKFVENPVTPIQGARIQALATLPGRRRTTGGHEVAQLAVLGDGEGGAKLDLYAPQGGLVLQSSLTFRGETARGLHGYYYKLSSRPEELDEPLLAVATTSVVGPREQLVVRVFRWNDRAGRLDVLRTLDRPCGYCISQVPACSACSCNTSLNLSTEITFSTADADLDGYADLAVGANTDFNLHIFYSSVHAGSPPEDRQYPPDLSKRCQCAQFGKVLTTFQILDLGGPTERPGVDMIVGDVSGAFVKYSAGTRAEGPSCDLSNRDPNQCPMGTQCVTLCPTSTSAAKNARCLQPCDMMNPRCDALPLRTTCIQPSAMINQSYCAGPTMGTGQPNSVWKLVNIHDLAKGRFRKSSYDDAVAVGSGSPAPGSDDGGRIRIIFGEERLDLTQVDMLSADKRNQSYFDLAPRALPMRGLPSGPRSVEVADFNGDGIDDLAVLFVASEEVHVWLGGANRGPGEIEGAPRLSVCDRPVCPPADRCAPFREFVTGDYDGDGKAEILVLCTTGGESKLRWFRPGPI